MVEQFWADKGNWPRDPSGRRFLARAVCDVGRTLYPKDWSDRDAVARPLRPLDPFGKCSKGFRSAGQVSAEVRTSLHPWQNSRARALLEELRPGFEARVGPSPIPPSFAGWDQSKPNILHTYFTEDEWETARAENDRRIAYLDPGAEAYRRFSAACHQLAEWALQGLLQSYIRPKRDISMRELHPDWWAAARLHNVFAACQMNPADPLSIACAGDKFEWIFIDDGALKSVLASLASGSSREYPSEDQEAAVEPNGVDRVEAEVELGTSLPPLPVRGARSGRRYDDETLFKEMAKLYSSGECTSIQAAALFVVTKAEGGGTPESKISRLSRGYSRWSKSRRLEITE